MMRGGRVPKKTEAIPSTNLYHSVEKKRCACNSLTRYRATY